MGFRSSLRGLFPGTCMARVGDVFLSLSPVAFMRTIWHGGVQEFFFSSIVLWKFIFYCSVNGRKPPWIRYFVLFISEYCP